MLSHLTNTSTNDPLRDCGVIKFITIRSAKVNLFTESIEGGTYVAGYGEEKADTLLRDKKNKIFVIFVHQ